MTNVKVTEEVKQHRLPDGFDLAQVSTAVQALLTHNSSKKEASLFPESTSRLLLDITTYKIPDGEHHFYPITLPFSPYPESLDILLVIPDDLKETKTEPEHLVIAMKDKLLQLLAGTIKIREVMTLKQLRDEYSTYEAKKALAKRIDLVLADRRIFKNLSSILGREFYRKKKFPLGINLEQDEEKWLDEFKYLLRKTMLNLSTNGPTATLVVGNDGLTADEITQNLSKTVNWLHRKYPGGWANISKLSVYVAGVPPLVIYLGNGSIRDVTKSVCKGGKLPEPETDELSTLPGRKIRVHPRGEIEILKDEDLSDEETVNTLGVERELKFLKNKKRVGERFEPLPTKKSKKGRGKRMKPKSEKQQVKVE